MCGWRLVGGSLRELMDLLIRCIGRTVARKSSKGGLYVCAGGLDIQNFDKNSTDLHCFTFR